MARERSFRVSPLRLALLAELAEGLRYECGHGDWGMETAEATIRARVAEVRAHYGDADVPAREALAEYVRDVERAAARAATLAVVERMRALQTVLTDGKQTVYLDVPSKRFRDELDQIEREAKEQP